MKHGAPLPTPLRATRNKGASSVYLPDAGALDQLMGSDAEQSAMSNYAKLTPSGRAALADNINDMASKGVKIV